MADSFTTFYNLDKIEVGTSKDTWGGKVNANYDVIDAALHAHDTALAAKLAAASYTAADVLAKLLTVDGAGSTLDADTLDGHDSAFFAPATAVAAAAILAALLTVDGAGSNLDADKLDGIDSAGFATAAHNHDATYLKLGGGTVTADILRSGLPYIYQASTGMTHGEVFITDTGASDPTTLPGQIWIKYTP